MRQLTMAMAFVLAAVCIEAQAPSASAPATGPAPTGLVVGSGNFFSPIVSDLDRSAAFYRDGLGFEAAGAISDAANNAPLRNMFGLPDAQLLWLVARPAGMRNGVEIVEVKNASGHATARNVQDPGAVTIVLAVRDIETL